MIEISGQKDKTMINKLRLLYYLTKCTPKDILCVDVRHNWFKSGEVIIGSNTEYCYVTHGFLLKITK